MYKNYLIPLQIFLILEKTNINFYFSNKNYFNSYNLFINSRKNILLNFILKNEIFLNDSSLIENSAIDTKFYNNLDNFNFINKKYSNIIFYNYQIYSSKIKLFIYFFNSFNSLNSLNKINSLDKIFPNANWIERETSEMYGIYFNNKKDHRKLMLDYSINETPLKKIYPVEGTRQVFFSFFENQVITQNNKYIEI